VPVGVIAEGYDAALGRSVEAVRELFAAAACSVALVDDDGGTLLFVASALLLAPGPNVDMLGLPVPVPGTGGG